MNNLTYRRASMMLLCAAAIAVCVALSLTFGARGVNLSEILTGLFGRGELPIGAAVVRERVPRTVLGLIAGAALGMSGALMQAVTRNPLADPGILGVNTGAALAVVCGIAFFGISTLNQYIAFALVGAGASAVFVYSVGSLGRGGATPIKLALAGAATTAALSSLISAVMLPRAEHMEAFRFWQSGGIGGATWAGIGSVSPLFAVGAVIAVFSCGSLNALALGDDAATSLGVRTGRARLLGAGAGVLLCGAATAIAGPIGFVGLMIPHAVRLVTGPDLRWVLPLSAVGGAVMLLAADVAGRLLGRPGEIDAGLVTAFIGAPALIIIAMRSKVRSL
ncbi:MAG: iron ABC transporter permease [Clostridiales bacterium]|jgi:iron complex transport system permease protein|nr:iron ABC transporter permease [Clostridiales bacterium]